MENMCSKDYANYDVVNKLAFEKQKAARNAIEERLKAWSEGHWSEDTGLVFQILKSFREEYIQNDDYEEICLENWECGLCQMLDIQDDNVCSLLPYLLTAYIYNFPKNRFVSGFLADAKKRKIVEDLSFWSAYRKPDDYSFLNSEDSDQDASNQDTSDKNASNQTLTHGIGKLFTSNFVSSTIANQGISKGYRQQKTNRGNSKAGSAKKPQQCPAEAAVMT